MAAAIHMQFGKSDQLSASLHIFMVRHSKTMKMIDYEVVRHSKSAAFNWNYQQCIVYVCAEKAGHKLLLLHVDE